MSKAATIETKYRGIIKTAALAAAGVGGPGVFFPVLDTTAVAGIWTTMVLQIGEASGRGVTAATAAKVAGAAVAACSAYMLGTKVLTFAAMPLVAAFPLAGVPMVTGLNVILNGLFTFRLGRACAHNFERPDFSLDELLETSVNITAMMISVPSGGELRAVKELLFG
jgi:hypothetical protein